MPRSSIPKYRLHRQSGQTVVTLRDGPGQRRDVLLGRHGTPESRKEYARVIAEWESNGHRSPRPVASATEASVNEVLLAFWNFAEGYYRDADGQPTSEVNNLRRALRLPKKLYGTTPAADFDSVTLEAIRGQMIAAGLCRNLINKDVDRIKRAFRWAASRKLVPLAVYQSLQTVPGLRRGRSAARETEPVRPVADQVVAETLPFLLPQARAMVQIQRLTGMRPGKVCVMRSMDLDTTGEIWAYRPGSDRGPHGAHKNAYRGHSRIVAIGPRAQEVLKPWLRLNLAEYLFQPHESRAQFDADRKARRKSKVTPSQARRRPKKRPKRRPGDRYITSSYGHAVNYGIVAANKARACYACQAKKPADRCEKCQAECPAPLAPEPAAACEGHGDPPGSRPGRGAGRARPPIDGRNRGLCRAGHGPGFRRGEAAGVIHTLNEAAGARVRNRAPTTSGLMPGRLSPSFEVRRLTVLSLPIRPPLFMAAQSCRPPWHQNRHAPQMGARRLSLPGRQDPRPDRGHVV